MSSPMNPSQGMKSNTKLSLGLVGLALVLGSYMYFVESKKDAPLDTKDVQVWSFTENQAKTYDTLAVTAEGKTATFTRSGEVWKVKEQPGREVEKSGFDIATGYLRSFVAMRKVENPGELKGYGLDQPKGSLAWSGGGQKLQLSFGEKTPTGDAYYVKAEAPYEGVYTVAAFKVDAWKGLATATPLVPLPSPAASGAAAPAAVPGHSDHGASH